jgi:hypothetical protein
MKSSIFQNSNENIVKISAMKSVTLFFYVSDSSLGHNLVFTGTLFLISTFLIYVRNGKHKHMVCKNFQRRNPYNIFVAILEDQYFVNSFRL